MLKVEFATDGAAFHPYDPDPDAERMECARILRLVAAQLESGLDEASFHDHNGNTVGFWSLETTATAADDS